jgi:hypothetical protein
MITIINATQGAVMINIDMVMWFHLTAMDTFHMGIGMNFTVTSLT